MLAPMTRHFNTAGPCKPDIHYVLPPERRLGEVRGFVASQSYVVLHAPRQLGKTTSLMALAKALTQEGRFAAALVSMEAGAAFPDDVGAAEDAALGAWRRRAENQLPQDLWPPPWPDAKPGARVGEALRAWARASARPLVVFLDEIDALEGNALVSVLRQLRDGHPDRPKDFPWSIALIGMRDVRDYKMASGGSERSRSASPFNIKVESLTMREFTADEVTELYSQHTDDTGQRFEPEACARAFELSQGQPWLVNALARQATERLVTDRGVAITEGVIDRAKDELIRRQDTHLDSLAERLREPRVRAVIEPLLAGEALGPLPDDDRRYVLDLGLVRESPLGGFVVANPIYREVIPRSLAAVPLASLPQIEPAWLRPDGSLDPDALLSSFLSFWRQHGEVLQGASPYAEVAPHLVLMAFVHRVVNGGGRVEREYALGRGRIDLLIDYRGVRVAIELKTWRARDKKRDPAVDGLVQLDDYMARTDAPVGWLVVFDQRTTRARTTDANRVKRVKTASGKAAVVVRL